MHACNALPGLTIWLSFHSESQLTGARRASLTRRLSDQSVGRPLATPGLACHSCHILLVIVVPAALACHVALALQLVFARRRAHCWPRIAHQLVVPRDPLSRFIILYLLSPPSHLICTIAAQGSHCRGP
jgi:hypothetical protein